MRTNNNILTRGILSTCVLIIAAMLALGFSSCGEEKPQQEPDSLTTTPEGGLEVETIRLLSYNILEGMKEDKTNNYDNFVAWMNEIDPDIFAIQEANKLTDEILGTLAARFGHQYIQTNIKSGDNYPVALTSKYPIELVRKITQNVSHGAVHVRIKGVSIVNLHLWPQGYGEDGPGGTDTGDAYRLREINTFLDQTIRRLPLEEKWLMMGDFNSSSPADKDDLTGGANRNYDVHNTVLNAGYVDAMRYMYPNYFVNTTPTGMNPLANPGRIDFIYGTQSMMRDITHASTVKDYFTEIKSDHYPVMIEFRVYNQE